ncbi:MAG TPA: class I SAM-dependent methyltransferase [Bacteroidota bacterium]|nr:class I SAM-dependent methyltransferase [Bacteroidota bacterium]
MDEKNFTLSDELLEYMLSVSLREPELLRKLREETATKPGAHQQIVPEQGQFMAFLIQMSGAKKTLEVGVFTGYSTLCVALALPPEGRVIACDINPETTSIARRYWTEAGVGDKIALKLAPALQTMDELIKSGEGGTFDFIFIDADRKNYDAYYERSLDLLRRGGIIMIDNVLWSGRVLDSITMDSETAAIDVLNRKLHDDARITLSMLPMSDGITLAMKR